MMISFIRAAKVFNRIEICKISKEMSIFASNLEILKSWNLEIRNLKYG